jgi:hypothetical protein
MLAALLAIATPAAFAQGYGPSLGDLGGVASNVAPGSQVSFTGDGFAPGGDLDVVLTSDSDGSVTELGTAVAGQDGTAHASFAVPEGLAPGAYTLSVSGGALDGGTRVLSAGLQVNPQGAGSSSGTGSAVPFIIGGIVLLIAAAGGLFWWRSRNVYR